VELRRDEERVVADLDDLHQALVGEVPRRRDRGLEPPAQKLLTS
jgi:hypothetical protein